MFWSKLSGLVFFARLREAALSRCCFRRLMSLLSLRDGLSCDGLSCDGLSCDGLSCDGLSCDGLSCYGLSRALRL
ncbi:MAG: hypothetical protein EBV34_06755 [Betaproteobacteria bacterium]|nr:hypothetical protein [Betaproteobacteria bacterium]